MTDIYIIANVLSTSGAVYGYEAPDGTIEVGKLAYPTTEDCLYACVKEIIAIETEAESLAIYTENIHLNATTITGENEDILNERELKIERCSDTQNKLVFDKVMYIKLRIRSNPETELPVDYTTKQMTDLESVSSRIRECVELKRYHENMLRQLDGQLAAMTSEGQHLHGAAVPT